MTIFSKLSNTYPLHNKNRPRTIIFPLNDEISFSLTLKYTFIDLSSILSQNIQVYKMSSHSGMERRYEKCIFFYHIIQNSTFDFIQPRIARPSTGRFCSPQHPLERLTRPKYISDKSAHSCQWFPLLEQMMGSRPSATPKLHSDSRKNFVVNKYKPEQSRKLEFRSVRRSIAIASRVRRQNNAQLLFWPWIRYHNSPFAPDRLPTTSAITCPSHTPWERLCNPCQAVTPGLICFVRLPRFPYSPDPRHIHSSQCEGSFRKIPLLPVLPLLLPPTRFYIDCRTKAGNSMLFSSWECHYVHIHSHNFMFKTFVSINV